MIAMFTPSFSQCGSATYIVLLRIYSMPPCSSKFPQLILAKVFYTTTVLRILCTTAFLLCKWWWWWRYLICYQQYHHHIHQGASFFFPSSQRLPLLFFKHKKVLFAMSAQAQKTSCKEAGIEYNMYLHTTHKKQKEVITFFAQFANRGEKEGAPPPQIHGILIISCIL